MLNIFISILCFCRDMCPVINKMLKVIIGYFPAMILYIIDWIDYERKKQSENKKYKIFLLKIFLWFIIFIEYFIIFCFHTVIAIKLFIKIIINYLKFIQLCFHKF